MRVYADSAALAAYPGGTAVPSDDVDALLRTASRVVGQLTRLFVYDTDADGMPTDPDVAQAMSDATCAIAVEANATGSLRAGATKQWSNVTVGKVSLGSPGVIKDAVVILGLAVPPAALIALQEVGCVGVWLQ